MDIPLEALKIVSEAAPTQDGSNHNLIWTPENGFVLSVSVGGQFQPIRFDYGDTINEIKEEITMLTGIPMPEQKKKETKKEGPPMDKEASTPLLDKIAAMNTQAPFTIDTQALFLRKMGYDVIKAANGDLIARKDGKLYRWDHEDSNQRGNVDNMTPISDGKIYDAAYGGTFDTSLRYEQEMDKRDQAEANLKALIKRGREASTTPLLDGIKEAVLGGENLGSLSGRRNAQQAALNSALGSSRSTDATPTTPTHIIPSRASRPGLLSRISSFHKRVTEGR